MGPPCWTELSSSRRLKPFTIAGSSLRRAFDRLSCGRDHSSAVAKEASPPKRVDACAVHTRPALLIVPDFSVWASSKAAALLELSACQSRSACPGGAIETGGLCAAPDEWPAGSVVHELSATVLDIAIAWAERSTGRRDSRSRHATHHRTHRAADHRAGNNAGCGSCALLRRLTGSRSEADEGCKDELAHGRLLCCRQRRPTS